MAEVLGRYVAGDSGVYMSALEARYFEIESPEFFRLEQAGAFDEDVEGLLVRASRVVDVTQLARITQLAKDYLQAEVHGNMSGSYERDALAEAIIAAGLATEHDVYDMTGEDDK